MESVSTFRKEVTYTNKTDASSQPEHKLFIFVFFGIFNVTIMLILWLYPIYRPKVKNDYEYSYLSEFRWSVDKIELLYVGLH